MTPEQMQAIAEFRSRNLSPKQIARQLGLRPAEVSAAIKAQAEQTTADRLAAGELHPIFQCLVNKSCLPELLSTRDSGLVAAQPPDSEDPDELGVGFAIVILSRKVGFNRLELCTYLVDYWCLGLKDVGIPRQLDPTNYKDFVEYAYSPFPEGIEEISLELAQSIVFGGIDYAATLGFQPHRDFDKARNHLGPRGELLPLSFGRNGKPFYANGPHDNPMAILRTLRETVGEGNFNFLIGDGGAY